MKKESGQKFRRKKTNIIVYLILSSLISYIQFFLKGKRYLPFEPGYSFQVYHDNLLYEFIPNNPQWSLKIACIYEGLRLLQKNS